MCDFMYAVQIVVSQPPNRQLVGRLLWICHPDGQVSLQIKYLWNCWVGDENIQQRFRCLTDYFIEEIPFLPHDLQIV